MKRFAIGVLKFVAIFGIIGVHHIWFGIEGRSTLKSAIDGLLLIAMAHAFVRLTK